MKFQKLKLRCFVIFIVIASCTLFSISSCKKDKNFLSADPMSLVFESNDTDEQTVEIKTDALSVESTPSVGWIVPTTKGTTILSVKVEPHSDINASRVGKITLTAGSADPVVIEVTQKAQTFTLSTDSIFFTNSASSRTFTITSQTDWTVSRGTTSWLSVSPSSGSNNGTVTVTASSNTGSSTRTAKITVTNQPGSSKTITVTQTPPSAQVRFRKLVSTPDVTQLGVMNSSESLLASYNFGSASGTSDYYSIPVGNHTLSTYFLGVWGYKFTHNFQVNRRYTFELTRIDNTVLTLTVINE